MTTINDILCRMHKGYNITVYNTISHRFMDDFDWDGKFTNCKLNIGLTHYTNIDKVEFETDRDGCYVINFYIFDYAHITDFLDYCLREKCRSKSDRKVTLAVVTKDGNIDTYEINPVESHFMYTNNFLNMWEEKYRKFYYRNDEFNINKYNTFECEDGSLIVTVFL